MNSAITFYSIPYLVCIVAFGATIVSLLATVLERRWRSRRSRNSMAAETRRLAA
jgi:hypothetical protein